MIMNDCQNIGGTSDQIYEVLSDPTRQLLLYKLQRIGTPTTIEAVAGECIDTTGGQPDGVEQSEETKQIEVALHHVHLPKMADAGVIDYDPGTGTIRTNDTTETVYAVLDNLFGENGFDRY